MLLLQSPTDASTTTQHASKVLSKQPHGHARMIHKFDILPSEHCCPQKSSVLLRHAVVSQTQSPLPSL